MDYEKILADLHAKRKELISANESALKAAAEASRDLTDDEQTAFDGNLDAIKAIDQQIKRVESQRDAAEAASVGEGRRTSPDPAVRDPIPAPGEQRGNAQPEGGDAALIRRIAATVRGPRPRYYTGDNARERAYRDGRMLHAQLFGASGAASAKWCEDHGIPIRGLQENTTPGSVVVHPEFSNIIIDLRENFGVFRRFARIQPMASEAFNGTVQTGGVTAYPVGEARSGTRTEPSWQPMSLAAKAWQTEVRYTRELAADAFINLADMVAFESARAFATAEDRAGFIGDGTGTYHGVFGVVEKIQDAAYASSIVAAASSNDQFSDLDLSDFERCVGALGDIPGVEPAWFISKAGWANSMLRLLDAAGGNTATIIEGRRQQEFIGYPVIFSNVLNSTLTAQAGEIACLFGDLSMTAVLGDRAGFELMSDPYSRMSTREITVYGTERFDINVHSLGQIRDNIWVTPMVALQFTS